VFALAVGFLITLYAFLITFWGAAWVLFLIGWISVGGRKAYFVEIADQILTALFCVVGSKCALYPLLPCRSRSRLQSAWRPSARWTRTT
jgi:hypothetical protein